MHLTARTERALEACYDAILAPTRWSVGPAIAGANRSARPVAHFPTTTAKTRRRRCRCPWDTRRLLIAGRAIKLTLQTRTSDRTFKQCTSFIRAGWTSALEHDLSTEEERRTLPFYQETARPEKREWLALSFFSVDGRDWCLPFLPRRRPVYARRRETPWQVRTPPRQNRQSRPKVCGVRRRVEALGARASELRGRRHRCDRPRDTDKSACANSAWRGLQPRPGSSDGPRSRQQSPNAAAGFVCFAYGARRRSVLSADRRRSGRSALASGRGDAGHGVRQRFLQLRPPDPSPNRSEVAPATRFKTIVCRVWPDRRGSQIGCKTSLGRRGSMRRRPR